MARYIWTGSRHTMLYSILKGLAVEWHVSYVVVDSTGVGAGLASFLDKALPGRVIPFVFTSKSKSDLGWRFLGVIETGRYKEPWTPASSSRPNIVNRASRKAQENFTVGSPRRNADS
jgi:hypothetical protein